MKSRFPRVASLKTPAGLRDRLAALGAELPCDDDVLAAPASPLAAPLDLGGGARVANRFVVQPMEGWDATRGGAPSELTERRWRRFGAGGAAWVWGGEAVAVRADGRANPNQLLMTEATAPAIGALRRSLVEAAAAAGHAAPYVGLQLTHSGRWSRPEGMPAPRTAAAHPILDGRLNPRLGTHPEAILSDAEVEELIGCYARAAYLAQEEGFAFVDLKHCHGYLLHEFLTARARHGAWGGASLGERTRLLNALTDAVREAAPALRLGVRLSVFDAVPREPDGNPAAYVGPYRHGFGVDPDRPDRIDLAEPIELVRGLVARGVGWINVTCASPYYAPHLQRPAAFPASDGYPPPEDPLLGVARLLGAARDLKAAVPEAVVVSSGWSYLQDFVPHVAQACVRDGWFDAVGLGRMLLSCPALPAQALAGCAPTRALVCRTFSDCTTAPRNGMVSGCYPLDDFYRQRPERRALEALKKEAAR